MARFLVCTFLCAVMLSSPAACFAQEEAMEYGYGSVVEVNKEKNEIVVSEYDWDKDEEVMVTYAIHPEAKVENAPSWKDIPSGTYIDVEYVTEKNGKKTAHYIVAYEPEAAMEEQPTEAAEE